ncbi:class I SAM-dependent methyltransferase [Candidatus Bipolaricaulota bacterium]
MFEKTARYYDKIYAFKDYAAEVRTLIGFVKRELGEARGCLLDVACGTGKHLEFLRESFEVEGLDLSPELLDVARERLPDVRFHCADMRDFEILARFDVIACLFSAIGYMTVLDDLACAIRSMGDHLVPGGLLIVEPWFTPEQWMPNTAHAMLIDEPELKIARVNTSLAEGRVSIVDLHHLIATPEETTHILEKHRLGLHTVDEMTSAFEQANLSVRYDEEGLTGRGLYLARKGSES